MKKEALLFSLLFSLQASHALAGDYGKLKKLIEKRDADGLRSAIVAGANVNDHSGLLKVTPLGIASGTDIRLVRILVEAGADVNAANRLGYTPLHNAAMINNSEIAKYLIEHGANIEARAMEGNTPLVVAYASPEVAFLLIEQGADYLVKIENGFTFADIVEAYSKDGAVLPDLRYRAQLTKSLTFPFIEQIEARKRAQRAGRDPFVTLFVDLVEYFKSPEGKVLAALGTEAIRYIQAEGSKYEPPSEPRLSDFSDWYEHADGSRHREATLFCPRPSRLVMQVEERFSTSGKHWFQRDVGAVLLPEHHLTLADAIAIECSTGTGLIDHDRSDENKYD